MSAEQAATLPLYGTTAEQALDLLDLGPGTWLLVTGAAGEVGSLAVELAVIRGLRVVAQGGTEDEAFVRGLGAELFVARGAALGPEVRRLVPGGSYLAAGSGGSIRMHASPTPPTVPCWRGCRPTPRLGA